MVEAHSELIPVAARISHDRNQFGFSGIANPEDYVLVSRANLNT